MIANTFWAKVPKLSTRVMMTSYKCPWSTVGDPVVLQIDVWASMSPALPQVFRCAAIFSLECHTNNHFTKRQQDASLGKKRTNTNRGKKTE